jgi:heat shock protein HslJ
MRTFFFGMLIVAAALSCGKSNDSITATGDKLSGRWKLIKVQDKGPVLETIAPPPGFEGNVYIDFSGNSFSGKTMMNTFFDGIFTLNSADSITFGSFSMTQVAENPWGSAFMTILLSCGLQSIRPCRPADITWLNTRKIEINSPMRYIITLEKF